MHLFTANGEIWDPNYEETPVLDDLLRRIVDAIRYRRVSTQSGDAYTAAVAKLTEAVTDYTATLRADPASAGPTPTVAHANWWSRHALDRARVGEPPRS